jgi:carboxymethylenebutenolidase
METQDLVTQDVQAGEYQSYLAYPKTEQKLPSVIIIHEVFGLNDNIKSVARRFASSGYVGLAVDMFSKDKNRRLCVFKTVLDLLVNIRKSAHMGALESAADYLRAQPQVAAEQLAMIGFCMGGSYALAFATHSRELKAASIFYGVNPRPLNSVAAVCPIVGSYPDKDFSTKHAQRLDQELTNYQRPHDIKIYPNTFHSFFNDQSKSYNQAAAEDSWQRTLSFFQEHLEVS